MLPQFLVQNSLLSTKNVDSFKINWELVNPILNLNFFHNLKLIEESERYRTLLRPWQQLQAPDEGLPDSFPIHSFFDAIAPVEEGSYMCGTETLYVPINIYPGSIVARTNSTTLIIIYRPLTHYIYNDKDGQFELAKYNNQPSIFRSHYLSGLAQSHIYTLADDNLLVTDESITCIIMDNTQWMYQSYPNKNPIIDPLTPQSPLLFSKDIIFCNIYLPVEDEFELIYHTIVQISYFFNPTTQNNEYHLTIPNFNFPSNAVLEYY